MEKIPGIVLTAVFFTVPYSALNAEEKEKHDPGGVELMFVQSSQSVSFGKNTMTLKGVSFSTVFFSDRPERIAGHLPTAHFLKIWEEGSDSFRHDPPNANLSILGEKEGAVNIVLELSGPRLKDNNLTYDIKVLEGKPPEEGGISSLFIDWWAAWGPGPRGYSGPYPRYRGPGPGLYCYRSFYTYGRYCHFGGPYYRPFY